MRLPWRCLAQACSPGLPGTAPTHPGLRLTVWQRALIQEHLADTHGLAGVDAQPQGQDPIHQLPVGAALPGRRRGQGRERRSDGSEGEREEEVHPNSTF